MLRQANLTITADPADVQANITRLTNEEIRLSQDLENLRQNNTDAQELVRLNKELQRVTRTLPQQTMAVPQNVGLNITNTVIQPANIGRLVDTTNAITQIDTELQQLDNLENDIQQLRNRYQQNIDTLNVLLPLQRLEEGLQRL